MAVKALPHWLLGASQATPGLWTSDSEEQLPQVFFGLFSTPVLGQQHIRPHADLKFEF